MAEERNRPELQRPGQHEGMEQQLNSLLALVTELKNRPTINVTVNVPADPDVKTILGIVQDIQAKMSGATLAEINEKLGPVLEKLKAIQ